jgi:hypothetical protein
MNDGPPIRLPAPDAHLRSQLSGSRTARSSVKTNTAMLTSESDDSGEQITIAASVAGQ